MANESDLNNLPLARVVRAKRLRISIIWIIPILAAIVAIGIAIQRIRQEGPTITIVFKVASGIEAGKTFIKYKDVTIGQVTKVELTQDYSKVQVTAQISKQAAALMVDDAKFWIVQPTISLSGVSGLNTLLSGQYIGFQSGSSSQKQRSYVALDTPPLITDQPGRRFTLNAATLGSVGVGAPVYYRSLTVGEVAAYSLAPDGKSIEVTIFINAPYDKYVTTETRFWNASGIQASVGANGIDIQTESIVSVLVGGIAFDVPDFLSPGSQAPANKEFNLFRNRVIAMTQPDPVERHFVLYFDESLRGLSVGAPVTLFGLTVGHVAEVGLTFNKDTLAVRPRVLITFSPDRLTERVTTEGEVAQGADFAAISPAIRARMLHHLVEDRGLRAQLVTGSLLTGELYVAFEYVPHAPKPKIDWSQDPLELPVASGGLASIEAKLNSILDKVDKIPLGEMASGLKDMVATLNQTLKQADVMLSRVNTDLLPEGTKTIEALHRTIADADRALLGKDSPTTQDLHDMMQELTDTARSIRILVNYLQQHPSSLIRGKKEDHP
jgi:paraquat-inducible protein B